MAACHWNKSKIILLFNLPIIRFAGAPSVDERGSGAARRTLARACRGDTQRVPPHQMGACARPCGFLAIFAGLGNLMFYAGHCWCWCVPLATGKIITSKLPAHCRSRGTAFMGHAEPGASAPNIMKGLLTTGQGQVQLSNGAPRKARVFVVHH